MFSNFASQAPADPFTLAATQSEFTFNLNHEQRFGTPNYYVQEGETFKAVGDENASTGYRWHARPDPNNECGPNGSITYERHYSASNSGMLGAPGSVEFTFHVNEKAKKNSECQIYFYNVGPGSSINGADRWFNIHIY